MDHTREEDLQYLKLLSIFHFVVGGILGLFACIPIFHVVIGIMMIVAPEKLTGGREEPPPPAVGWLFAVLGGAGVCLGWTFAVCLMLAGRFLARRCCYLFCLIMAGLACTFAPFGTVLGIFTILVLVRPSVKRLFQAGAAAQEPAS